MIGNSHHDAADPAEIARDVSTVLASRAVRMFPHLARVNVVRSWRAVRVMPADGFPIYDQKDGAWIVTCHSGVTLAAAHALTLAPLMAAGHADDPHIAAFGAARFANEPMFRRLEEGGAPLVFTFDGREIAARPGDTVAAALLAAGAVASRETPVSGAPRGPYCLMGVCFECLVTVDGVGNRQSCLTPVAAGMVVRTQRGRRDSFA